MLPSRVLITGATGAVGPAVVQHLHDQELTVRVLVRNASRANQLPNDVEVCVGDLTDPASVRAAVQGVDGIIHLAAFLHISDPSPAQLQLYYDINVIGTQTLLDAALLQGVKRFVYFSTTSVYGGNRSEVLSESSTLQLDTPYALSKRQGEELVLSACDTSGQPIGAVLRLASVYGVNLKGNYRRLVQALASGRFVPLGDGANCRTLVFDRDVARAAFLALCKPVRAGAIYNVTDGQFHTLHDIIAAICEALGRSYPPIHVPECVVRTAVTGTRLVAQHSSRSPSWANRLEKYLEHAAIDGARIQCELGFRPRVDLATGWREVVANWTGEDDLYNKNGPLAPNVV